jgi:hypothetical protein
MVNYNSTIHAIFSLALTTYKYNELQVPFATQKLSWKVSCKTPFFFIMIQKNDIWDLVELLVGKKPIFGKWVHKLK